MDAYAFLQALAQLQRMGQQVDSGIDYSLPPPQPMVPVDNMPLAPRRPAGLPNFPTLRAPAMQPRGQLPPQAPIPAPELIMDTFVGPSPAPGDFAGVASPYMGPSATELLMQLASNSAMARGPGVPGIPPTNVGIPDPVRGPTGSGVAPTFIELPMPPPLERPNMNTTTPNSALDILSKFAPPQRPPVSSRPMSSPAQVPMPFDTDAIRAALMHLTPTKAPTVRVDPRFRPLPQTPKYDPAAILAAIATPSVLPNGYTGDFSPTVGVNAPLPETTTGRQVGYTGDIPLDIPIPQGTTPRSPKSPTAGAPPMPRKAAPASQRRAAASARRAGVEGSTDSTTLLNSLALELAQGNIDYNQFMAALEKERSTRGAANRTYQGLLEGV